MDGFDRMVVALQDPTRREILLSFYADPGPRTVAEVTSTARVHRSVVYAHLEKLLSLGYLDSGRQGGRPGKPAKTYRLASNPRGAPPPGRNLFILSLVLSRALQSLGAAGVSEARESALAAGAGLTDLPVAPEHALDALRHLGERFVSRGHHELVVERCVFREVCATSSKVVSAAHSGLIEGVLRGAGVETEVTPRTCGLDGCSYRVGWQRWRELAPEGST